MSVTHLWPAWASPSAPVADLWDQSPRVFPRHVYSDRAKQVYWNDAFPACRAKGPNHSVCLLNIGHTGDHYGNGYDDYGPMGPGPWKQKQ